MLLKGKKILIGITASIAAYKSISLIRLLVKAGAEVKVVMTAAAKDFVSPLVVSVLSKNKVVLDWQEHNEWNNHVELGRWADVFLIAPLSCNTLSKMAMGSCDNLLLAVYLSATCPVAVAPAMDEDMWHHPSTKKNIQQIKEYGIHVLEVKDGELASGLHGEGRMSEPEDIFIYLIENYFRSTNLNGVNVLVSAGPTFEAIDPVRFIGNRSSGKMGFAIAKAFYLQGASVVLVSGPTHEAITYKGIKLIEVENAADMFDNCIKHADADIIIMSAAVADYTPTIVADQKIKKKEDDFQITLQKTKDILKYLGVHKKQGQYIAGFALETENEMLNATKKLNEKNADCIILNSLNDEGAGFGKDTNKITILSKKAVTEYELASKEAVADNITNYISKEFLNKAIDQ